MQQAAYHHGKGGDQTGKDLVLSDGEDEGLEIRFAAADHHAVQSGVADAQAKIAFQRRIGWQNCGGSVDRLAFDLFAVMRRVAPRHIGLFHERRCLPNRCSRRSDVADRSTGSNTKKRDHLDLWSHSLESRGAYEKKKNCGHPARFRVTQMA